MRRIFFAYLLGALSIGNVFAQTETLLEIDLGRKSGDSAVLLRTIVIRPAEPTDTAILFFRGNPGYMLIRSLADRNRNLGWLGKGLNAVLQSGVAVVMVDCPNDQWGETPRPPATSCLGNYRSSQQHADDVRRVMARLREEYKMNQFYLLGHSVGTVSSRWLAINLGKDEIAGTIHSATLNSRIPAMSAMMTNLMSEFPRRAAGAPMLFVHNEADACLGTPYGIVRAYATDNLITVRGGIPEGDPCGGGHLHSHQGREEPVAKAIVSWIKTRRVENVDP